MSSCHQGILEETTEYTHEAPSSTNSFREMFESDIEEKML